MDRALRYIDVCAGISAASAAFAPLGWQAAAYSEIEPFPRAVLEQRWGAVPTDFDCDGGLIAGTVSAKWAKWAKGTGGPAGDECQNLVAHSLRAEGFDASADGTGRQNLIPIAFDCKGTEVQFSDDGTKPTLRSMGSANSHQNGGVHAAAAFSIMPMNSGKDYKARETDVAQPLMAGGRVGGNQGGDYVAEQWDVRRLTPRECERLMGQTDDFTNITWREKPAPDGPRYKALGNSIAVNQLRWIGRRMAAVEAACAADIKAVADASPAPPPPSLRSRR